MRSIFIHLAWFNREDGGWIGEWAGHLPAPELPLGLIGESRILALNVWQQEHQRYITPDGSPFPMHDQLWDRNRWDECPAGGAVCLDVTRFAWPVGDHVWHHFDERTLSLDWPESSGQRFIQLDNTMTVHGLLHSHRPARSVAGRTILRITGTSLNPFWSELMGGHFEQHPLGGRFLPNASSRLASVFPEGIAVDTGPLMMRERKPLLLGGQSCV